MNVITNCQGRFNLRYKKGSSSLTEHMAKHDKQQHSTKITSRMIAMVRLYVSREDSYQPSCNILTRHSTGHLLPLLLPRYRTLQQHTSPSQRPLGFHLHHPKQSHYKLYKNILIIKPIDKKTLNTSYSPATQKTDPSVHGQGIFQC